MLEILLKHMNLVNKEYFTDYELQGNFLKVIASQDVKNDAFMKELVEITGMINKSIFDYAIESNIISVAIKPVFKDITAQAKKIVESEEFLFPKMYNQIFLDLILEKDKNFDISDLICGNLVEDQIVNHVVQLDSCANNALDAMVKHDEDRLQKVIDETALLKDKIELLRESVYEDSLTKVYNRKWFNDNYIDEQNTMFVKSGILAIVDINEFKEINDKYGHIAGDKVLVFLAMKLQKLSQNVVRYGGDEFFVIFDEIFTVEKVHDALHILRETLQKKELKTNKLKFKISFSYGIAKFQSTKKFEPVLAEADNMMYMDKGSYKTKH